MYFDDTAHQPDLYQEILAIESLHGNEIDAYFRRRGGRSATQACLVPRVILLCFTNRSGSTYLASEMSALGLCGTPNDDLNYEFLNAENVIRESERRGFRSFPEYFRYIAARHVSPRGYFCCKASIDQLVWLMRANAAAYFMEHPTFLRIIRRDVLLQAISMSIALQTKEWTSLHDKCPTAPVFDHGAIANLIRSIDRQNHWSDLFFAYVEPLSALFVYEDLMRDPEMVARSLERAFCTPLQGRHPRTLNVMRQKMALKERWHAAYLHGGTDEEVRS